MKINYKIILLSLLSLLIIVLVFYYFTFNKKEVTPKGLMILIESTDSPTGLINMVNQMNERNIKGLLMVTPEFVQANCTVVKDALSYGNIEIVPSNVGGPFWGVPYEEQKTRIIKMMDDIELCTGERPRIISSRYMASDMNTIKVAEELGIPYVTARGTTGDKATVYHPEGYNVKILSVSNIPLVPFKYGSLCDFSFYERAGAPDDMKNELSRAIEPLTSKEKIWFGENHKVTPVSHTYIGGYLKSWNEMWVNFWDNTKIEWVGLDEFMKEPDWTIPLWQIPTNINNPYTEEKVRPLLNYEDEEKVMNSYTKDEVIPIYPSEEDRNLNPCAVIGNEVVSQDIKKDFTEKSTNNKIVVLHNGQGPMCIEFLNFIKTLDYPVEQHLTTDKDFSEILISHKSKFNESEGLSSLFDYYPMIFINNRAFSGFDEAVKAEILKEVSKK